MKDLIELIQELTNDNLFISEFIDRNTELMKSESIDEMNEQTAKFHLFLNEFGIKNSKFKSLMESYKLLTIWDIKNIDGIDNDSLNALLKKFDSSVRVSQEKITSYARLISGELNTINKIKYFKRSGKIDFKL